MSTPASSLAIFVWVNGSPRLPTTKTVYGHTGRYVRQWIGTPLKKWERGFISVYATLAGVTCEVKGDSWAQQITVPGNGRPLSSSPSGRIAQISLWPEGLEATLHTYASGLEAPRRPQGPTRMGGKKERFVDGRRQPKSPGRISI